MTKTLKYLLIAIASICLSSCKATFTPENVVYLDYNKYITDNFYITESNSVNFKYVPLGSVIVNNYSITDLEKTFANFVSKSKEKGADGIINLRFYFSPDKSGDVSGYIISGMAIKRE